MIVLVEVEEYNQCFPAQRKSHVVIELADGRVLESGTMEAAGDPEMPFSDDEIIKKFMRFATGPLSESHAAALRDIVLNAGDEQTLEQINKLIYRPV